MIHYIWRYIKCSHLYLYLYEYVINNNNNNRPAVLVRLTEFSVLFVELYQPGDVAVQLELTHRHSRLLGMTTCTGRVTVTVCSLLCINKSLVDTTDLHSVNPGCLYSRSVCDRYAKYVLADLIRPGYKSWLV